jgi:hypothetical protein
MSTKTFGVESSNDIGFRYNNKLTSLQNQITRLRITEIISCTALVLFALALLK